MNRLLSAILIVSYLFLSVPDLWAAAAAPSPQPDSVSSKVTSKRVMIVAKSALYGFGGGLVVGLASQVFVKKVKNIFMFGSLGMYAGIVLGIYIISTSAKAVPYEGPDTYEDFSQNSLVRPIQYASLQSSRSYASLNGREPGEVRLTLLNLKF